MCSCRKALWDDITRLKEKKLLVPSQLHPSGLLLALPTYPANMFSVLPFQFEPERSFSEEDSTEDTQNVEEEIEDQMTRETKEDQDIFAGVCAAIALSSLARAMLAVGESKPVDWIIYLYWNQFLFY